MLKPLLTITALGLCVWSSAHANLVRNGDFEATVAPRGGYTIVDSISGWTGAPQIEIQNNDAGTPYSGNNLVELDANFNSSMFQDIATVAGQMYTVSFAYSPRPGITLVSNSIDFLWNGTLVQSLAADGTRLKDTAWTIYSFNLLATGSTSRIGFAATGTSDSFGGYLDDVTANAALNASIAAIPEPATVSLLGVGLMAAALGARRRRTAR